MLRSDMEAAGVTLVLGAEIGAVTQAKGFQVASSAGMFTAPRLVVATGGKSIPKMGATGFGYALARQFGLGLVETRPGLVPLTFSGEMLEETRALAGLSVPAVVRHDKTAFEEGLLFTHRGLSGPSILQISSYWREGDEISVDLAPGGALAAALSEQKAQAGRVEVQTALAPPSARTVGARGRGAGRGFGGGWPTRPDGPWTGWPPKRKDWRIRPVGSEGYAHRRGNAWPASTRAILDARSMEARKRCRACTLLARWWMSPAGWAAIIFNGRGPLVGRRGRRSKPCPSSPNQKPVRAAQTRSWKQRDRCPQKAGRPARNWPACADKRLRPRRWVRPSTPDSALGG